jgi:hypothetical protein
VSDSQVLPCNLHAQPRQIIERDHLFRSDVDRTGEIGIHQSSNAVQAFVDVETIWFAVHHPPTPAQKQATGKLTRAQYLAVTADGSFDFSRALKMFGGIDMVAKRDVGIGFDPAPGRSETAGAMRADEVSTPLQPGHRMEFEAAEPDRI